MSKLRIRKTVSRTVAPTQVSNVRETITLSSPKATVTNIREADLSWLAADVFSTASAYRS